MKPLVFLHGWAQSRQVWFQQRDLFPEAQYLNLPGHGGADDVPVDDWVASLAQQLPDKPCVLVGWSLGGILAQALALCFPERVAAMALVSTTPCFRSGKHWQHGCNDEVFAAFESAVSRGSAKALSRFFALMLHGDDLRRSDYNALAREAVDREYPTSGIGLSGGLSLLGSLDTRAATGQIAVPTLILHGEQDSIVSVGAGRWLATAIPDSRFALFPACGHAPFLTQSEKFNTTLINWRHTL